MTHNQSQAGRPTHTHRILRALVLIQQLLVLPIIDDNCVVIVLPDRHQLAAVLREAQAANASFMEACVKEQECVRLLHADKEVVLLTSRWVAGIMI